MSTDRAKLSWQRLSKAISRNHPTLEGETFERKETCSFCDSKEAMRLGKIEFWDLAECDVAQCVQCRQMQLDPMLTPDQMEAGCTAFDNYRRHQSGREWYVRNNRRHFRHGVQFGTKLKRHGLNPQSILEIGPGGGYFSRGVQEVFRDAKVTVLDIVDEVLNENREAHGHSTIKGFPDQLNHELSQQFDLVMGRDVLEHIADPFLALKNMHQMLKPGGHLYILTPNGYEDVWRIHMNWWFERSPALLLNNHVSYFDAAALVDSMQSLGMVEVDCFQTLMKRFRKGFGWRFSEKFVEEVKTFRHADYLNSTVEWEAYHPDEVLPQSGHKLLEKRPGVSLAKISTDRQIGHYISCLMRKT